MPPAAPGSRVLLTVPARLIADMADTPLAIGIYTLVARLFVCTGGPVPLSEAEIARYDPSLKRGAVVRALARLRNAGWLVGERDAGSKSVYLPTWGSIAGSPRPWNRAEKAMGRPRHLFVTRVDAALFDIGLGRLAPHAQQPAHIERYTSAPLFTLAEVGAYTLACAGRPLAPADALLRFGLILPTGAAAPMPELPTLLSLVSQQMLFDESAPRLSARGLARLGFAPEPQQAASSQPLLFVPEPMIGQRIGEQIGGLIGETQPAVAAFPAPESAKTQKQVRSESSHGTHANQSSHEHPSRQRQEESVSVDASTATARRLHEIGVRSHAISRHMHTPLERVEAAISDARSRYYVNNSAAWVVRLLDDPGFAPIGTSGANWLSGTHPEAIQLSPDLPEPACDLPKLDYVKSNLEQSAAGRNQRLLAQRLQLEEKDAALCVVCASPADLNQAQSLLGGLLRALSAEAGFNAPLRFRIGSVAQPPAQARPVWIDAAAWALLPGALRGALEGARLEAGAVHGATPARDQLLHHHYHAETQALVQRAAQARC